MLEETESVNEDEPSFQPEEWIKWFEHFKDEKGDWILDNTVLEALTAQFGKDKNENLTDSAEEMEEEQRKKEAEGELESEESQREDMFLNKLQEFTVFARDYLSTKSSTLIDCNRPYRASNPKFWFYKEFREYLENQGFIENMVNVLVKMFDMHPELPEDPLSFIRDNYGISQKEEDRLIAEWAAVTEEMIRLEEEGKALEKRIKWLKKQPRDEDWIGSGNGKPVQQVQRKSERKQSEEKPADETTEESTFHWDFSDPPSLLSFPSILRPAGSELSLLLLEEDQAPPPEPESSVTPDYEFDDFNKNTDESSSSLDAGSLQL